MAARMEQLILDLFAIEAVKFGDFTLKSGIQSPIYFDLRVIVSYPVIMNEVAELLWETTKTSGANFATVCGVPYTALPLATLMSAHHDVPMLIRRKEAKDYGTKKMIEGKFEAGSSCLIVEDVVTSGSSVRETAQALESVGLVVTDAVVLLDREQGGKQKLKDSGIALQSICGTAQLLRILRKHEKIPESVAEQVRDFVRNNSFQPGPEPPVKKARKALSYGERGDLCQHPVAKQLFDIMERKKSNLAVSADLCTAAGILKLADEVGPHICMLKTHVDIITDFSAEFVQSLTQLAEQHEFLIFEDRKFADIGSTVQHQYQDGLYQISGWAHLINAHALPGPGVLEGLKQVGLGKQRACLLIAEMSSRGNLATGEYTKATVKMAEEHRDFVVGFISQSQLSQDPAFIHMTPGPGPCHCCPALPDCSLPGLSTSTGKLTPPPPQHTHTHTHHPPSACQAYQHRLTN
ncbi:uridine 5'-monophosphate synthase-like isoform X3 [Branchiostoma floridae x Branchiostoma japonicum]